MGLVAWSLAIKGLAKLDVARQSLLQKVGPNIGPKLPNTGRNTGTQAGLSALRNSRKIRAGDTQRHSMQPLSAIKKIAVFCGFFPGRCLAHCSLHLMSRRIGCQPLCHGFSSTKPALHRLRDRLKQHWAPFQPCVSGLWRRATKRELARYQGHGDNGRQAK